LRKRRLRTGKTFAAASKYQHRVKIEVEVKGLIRVCL
jgi:hypothetical protein